MFECMQCIHTDSPCLPSDYGRDEHDYCDHFKNVFEENEELKAQIEKIKYTLKKIIETVHNDRIDEYGARLVLIHDFAYECLEEIKEK